MSIVNIAKLLAPIFTELGVKLYEHYTPKLIEFIKERLEGKTIAIIGPTASGKDSLIARLRGQEIPEVHINTGAPEKVEKFKVVYRIPHHTEGIPFYIKESVNVGGEEPDRNEYWEYACKEANYIFYILDVHHYTTHTEEYAARIKSDIYWLAGHLSQNQNASVVVILNKIDLLIHDAPNINERKNSPEIQNILKNITSLVRDALGTQVGNLKGVNPLSIKNREYYAQLFPSILRAASGK